MVATQNFTITLIEKVQRSFTKHITGMRDLSYHERLQALRLYSLQRRRERYCIILIWKIIESKAQNLSDPILCNFSDRRGRSCVISHVNTGRQGTIASVGELFAYLTPYQNLFVTPQIVLFVASNKDLIATSTVFRISPALLDTTTAWMVETAYNGGHFVMT